MTWKADINALRPFSGDPNQSNFMRERICPRAIGLQLRDTKGEGGHFHVSALLKRRMDFPFLIKSIYVPKREPALCVTKTQIQAVKDSITPTPRGDAVAITLSRSFHVVVDDDCLKLLSFLDTTFRLHMNVIWDSKWKREDVRDTLSKWRFSEFVLCHNNSQAVCRSIQNE